MITNKPYPPPEPKREPRLTFAHFAAVVIGVLVIAAITLPAMLGPAYGNIFSNVVRNL